MHTDGSRSMCISNTILLVTVTTNPLLLVAEPKYFPCRGLRSEMCTLVHVHIFLHINLSFHTIWNSVYCSVDQPKYFILFRNEVEMDTRELCTRSGRARVGGTT